MPPEEAGYTYAVEPTANNRLLANEEESIYGRSDAPGGLLKTARNGPPLKTIPKLLVLEFFA